MINQSEIVQRPDFPQAERQLARVGYAAGAGSDSASAAISKERSRAA